MEKIRQLEFTALFRASWATVVRLSCIAPRAERSSGIRGRLIPVDCVMDSRKGVYLWYRPQARQGSMAKGRLTFAPFAAAMKTALVAVAKLHICGQEQALSAAEFWEGWQ